jgi:hypothetical protein
MPGQESRGETLRDGRQVARQRGRFFRFVSGDIDEIVHIWVVYRKLAAIWRSHSQAGIDERLCMYCAR